ncbi:alpha/beta-hydrolase [Cytidiella melzeri]|nr:alpha/beta-hydrolase [Cytidiella melzeri]
MAHAADWKRLGPFAFQDTGVPSQQKNYTTLVLLHGYCWHSGIFARCIPFVDKYHCRLVLINRRDYPGSSPLTEDQRRLLNASAQPGVGTSEAVSDLLRYSKTHALDLHDFLCTFIQDEGIAAKSVILVGWSFGAVWITQLLAYASSLSARGFSLCMYIKRAIWYDIPYNALGYPPPATFYNPLTDPSHSPAEVTKIFLAWLSGYYTHGAWPSKLEYRTPLQDPPPTVFTMTPSEFESALCTAPGNPGGSDEVFLHMGVRHGLYKILREQALYTSPLCSCPSPENAESKRSWDDVELYHIWCDQSSWMLSWATWSLLEELREAEEAGRAVRKMTVVRMSKANHFAHWDQPERTLKTLLSDSPEEYNVVNLY